MLITDIIALAKEGYKPSDIKELLELTNNANVSTNEDISVQPVEVTEDHEDKDVDYKALYEAQLDEIAKLKSDNKKVSEDLKQAQKNNINQDISNNKNIDAPIDIWTKFIKER